MKKLVTIFVLLFSLLSSSVVRANNLYKTSDYQNSIKITFLSWISGSTKLSYERALRTLNQSSEICASIVGAGFDKYNNDPKGFTMRYGHKFFLKDNREMSLEGFYLRPEIVYSHYTYNCINDGSRSLSDEMALLGTIGYQFIHKRFLADFWLGAGYASGTPADTYYHHGFELWHYLNSVNVNIALSFSIRLGICF